MTDEPEENAVEKKRPRLVYRLAAMGLIAAIIVVVLVSMGFLARIAWMIVVEGWRLG